MPAAGDDQARRATDRLDQQLASVLERHDACGAALERIGQQTRASGVDRAGVADAIRRSITQWPSAVTVRPCTRKSRAEGDAVSRSADPSGRSRRRAGPLAAERGRVRLDVNPHRAAAHETGVPGERFGEVVRAKRRPTFGQHAARFRDRVALDAAAAERSGQSGRDRRR